MRLWSIHPEYLDRQGLCGAWREGLLAQKVIDGKTKCYRNHPQLERFLEQAYPLKAIGAYLSGLRAEGASRGYKFDGAKILFPCCEISLVPVNTDQLIYEAAHLLDKLHTRSPGAAMPLCVDIAMRDIKHHTIFAPRAGPIEKWERAK